MGQIDSALSEMIIESELADRDRLDSIAREAEESGFEVISVFPLFRGF